MEAKKNKKYDINQYRTLFFNIGLVITMMIIIGAFEWKSYDRSDLLDLGKVTVEFDEQMDVPVTEQPPPPAPKIQNVQVIEVPNEEEIAEEIELDLDIEMTEETVIEEIIEITVDEVVEEEAEEIFQIVENPPTFPGGYAAFYKVVSDELKFPSQAQRLGVEGKVFAEFVVGKDGKITDIKIIRGIGAGCDEEAIRVLKLTPAWNPGKQRGKSVKVRMVLPITFKLQ